MGTLEQIKSNPKREKISFNLRTVEEGINEYAANEVKIRYHL